MLTLSLSLFLLLLFLLLFLLFLFLFRCRCRPGRWVGVSPGQHELPEQQSGRRHVFRQRAAQSGVAEHVAGQLARPGALAGLAVRRPHHSLQRTGEPPMTETPWNSMEVLARSSPKMPSRRCRPRVPKEFQPSFCRPLAITGFTLAFDWFSFLVDGRGVRCLWVLPGFYWVFAVFFCSS